MAEEKLDISYFRELLVKEQGRIKKLLGAVTDNLDLNNAKTKKNDDDDDEATHKLKNRLKLINDALGRVEKGNYGRCVCCNKSIPSTTLESNPEVVYCGICDLKQHIR